MSSVHQASNGRPTSPAASATLPRPTLGAEQEILPADPSLTASLYAAGLLDDALLRAVLPLSRDLEAEGAEFLLWMVRYGRRGQHLKLRLHVNEADLGTAEALLARRLDAYLEGIRDLPAVEDRPPKDQVPVIDEDDAEDGLAPDRTWIRSRYQRSFVNLGGEPFLSLDPYASAMARALSAGLGLVLAQVAPHEATADGPWEASMAARQKMLIKVLLAAAGPLAGDDADRAARYFEFHRDCLLRFYVPDLEEERSLLELYERQVQASPVAALAKAAAAGLGPVSAETEPTNPVDRWRHGLVSLVSYLETFADDPDYLTHPRTREVAWPPLFKVLHGVANQAGLPPLKEAYVHHLVSRVFTVVAESGSAS